MSGKSKFNRPKRRIEVDFDGHEDATLHGLVVTYQTMSMGKMLDLMRLMTDSKGDAVGQADAMERMIARLADGIVSWNYCADDSDDVAEISVATLRDMDPDLLFILVDQWQSAIAGVPAPLDRRSDSGRRSLEELPTVVL